MHRPVSRRTCIQDADIINPAVGCPPEVESIPASLCIHSTIRCPWKLNGHLLNATLSSRVGCPCVDLWIPCGADVERQGPVEVNIIWTNLRARECRIFVHAHMLLLVCLVRSRWLCCIIGVTGTRRAILGVNLASMRLLRSMIGPAGKKCAVW